MMMMKPYCWKIASTYYTTYLEVSRIFKNTTHLSLICGQIKAKL